MSVVPDFIEVETAWRTWTLQGDMLSSYSYPGLWKPGEPMQATCQSREAPETTWQCVPVEEAVESELPTGSRWTKRLRNMDAVPRPPAVQLPFGLEYVYRELPRGAHESPSASCKCGIYAAHSPDGCAGYGKHVIGKVSLWGTVIPGETGLRGEYAYPAELFVVDTPIEFPRPAVAGLYWSFTLTAMMPPEAAPKKRQVEALADYGVPVHHVATWSDAEKLTRIPEGVR